MESSDLQNLSYDVSQDCGCNPDYKVRRKASVAGSLLERSLRLDCNWQAAPPGEADKLSGMQRKIA